MYAVELNLDAAGTEIVRTVWQRLAEQGFHFMVENKAAPHVTLGVFEEVDETATIAFLADFFNGRSLPPLQFDVLGSFPATNVLHCTPTVTAELLALHADFHRQIAPLTTRPYPYYLPGRWVPHCTLAFDLTPDQLPAAFTHALAHWQPFQCRLSGVSLVVPAPITRQLFKKRFEL